MDATKIGLFIAEKRKLKNLTQQDLADKLHLSNRTISKWECGKGIPDSAIMMELCEALDISVNELLLGENISNEEYKVKADKNIIALMNKPKNMYKKIIVSVLGGLLSEIILVVFLLVCIYANVMNGTNVYDFLDMPAALIVIGATGVLLLVTGLAKYFIMTFKIVFGISDDTSIEETEKCIVSIKVVMLSAFLSGLALSLASLVGTLVNVTTKNAGATNVAIAVCLLGFLYGVMICVIMIPLLGRLYKAKCEKMD